MGSGGASGRRRREAPKVVIHVARMDDSYLSSRQRIGEDRRAGRVQLGSATWQMT